MIIIKLIVKYKSLLYYDLYLHSQ